MPSQYDELLKSLKVNLPLHEELVANMNRVHEKTHVRQKNRPAAMSAFDAAFHDSHFGRVAEIHEHRKKGGKSIGTFCIYVPDEIAFAAGVVPFALCGGTGWSVSYADRMFPRDICPLVRSTFGMSFSGT